MYFFRTFKKQVYTFEEPRYFKQTKNLKEIYNVFEENFKTQSICETYKIFCNTKKYKRNIFNFRHIYKILITAREIFFAEESLPCYGKISFDFPMKELSENCWFVGSYNKDVLDCRTEIAENGVIVNNFSEPSVHEQLNLSYLEITVQNAKIDFFPVEIFSENGDLILLCV